jgi:N-acetylated-alpha-linked acidic dipeptidase
LKVKGTTQIDVASGLRSPLRHRAMALVLLAMICLVAPPSIRADASDPENAAPLATDAPASFTAAHADAQRDLERRLRAQFSRKRLRADLERLAYKPHRAGSAADREIAGYIAAELRRAGLEAEVVEYDHYLSSPQKVEAEIVLPERIPLTLVEDVVPSDPYTKTTAEHPAWNAYSASGSVTAQIVYAHHGSQRDFAALERLGVDLRRRILLMRYFGAGEGEKVRRAELAGAAAVILYADPRDDGYLYGDTYPKGPWRAPGSIMRRSVIRSLGDPLSPGWASRAGARRLAPDEAEGLPSIPVLPISYRDAEKILRHLAGPVAPAGWQGGLPLTYHLGPGPVTVRLDVQMKNHDGHIWNAIARIPGRELPDQWIVLGNHHDAWIYGAGDPSSGTAAFLELGRALGSLLAEGWRPRRTLILAAFDAEEITLGGATEWMEENAQDLQRNAVAMLNMDSAIFNPDRPLSLSASGSIRGMWLDVARAVPHARQPRSTYDVWLEQQNRFRNVQSVDLEELTEEIPPLSKPHVFADPIGDDQTVFYLHLALPVSDMYYGADYGVYHSIYENLHWMRTLVDPDFSYHELMASMLGIAALRMSEADLLPFDFAAAASDWQAAMALLERAFSADAERQPDLAALKLLTTAWREAALDLNVARANLLEARAAAAIPAERWREWNRRLMQVERSFYAKDGLPGAPWSRNLFSALRFESEESTLPGLRWALEDRDSQGFEQQKAVYAEALERARDATRSLAADLRSASGAAPQ